MSGDVHLTISIASPCSAKWEEMKGDDAKRFCSHCQLHVYNFEAMSRDEIGKLLTESTGRVCGRVYRRSDGTVLTRDCPVGLAFIRHGARRAVAKTAAVIALFLGSTWATWLGLDRVVHAVQRMTPNAPRYWWSAPMAGAIHVAGGITTYRPPPPLHTRSLPTPTFQRKAPVTILMPALPIAGSSGDQDGARDAER